MRNIKALIWCSLVYLSSSMASFGEMAEDYRDIFYSAVTNVTYVQTRQWKTESCSRYASNSKLDYQSGWIVHISRGIRECLFSPNYMLHKDGRNWIALIALGDREFCNVYGNTSVIRNVSAVIFYDSVSKATELNVQPVENVVTILMARECGADLVRALTVNNGTEVWINIHAGRPYTVYYTSINRTSVFFVSISFIVLTIASLAWLVFYYVQRMRHAYAKERYARHLYKAAKKAVGKMPLITVKSSDFDIRSEQCAICMDNYLTSDILRQLPCKHMFHKLCVDPWLMEQRSCPMCKLDILTAYGLQPPTQAATQRAHSRLVDDDVPFSLMDSSAFRGRHNGDWVPVAMPACQTSEVVVTVDAMDIAPLSHSDDDEERHALVNMTCSGVGDREYDPLLASAASSSPVTLAGQGSCSDVTSISLLDQRQDGASTNSLDDASGMLCEKAGTDKSNTNAAPQFELESKRV